MRNLKNLNQHKQKEGYLIKMTLVFAMALAPCLTKASINYEENNISYEIIDVESTKKIKGVVVDKDGEPIIGASVSVLGQKHGSITNIDGVFELNVEEGQKLQISFLGFTNQVVTIGKANDYKVTMTEDSTGLDEVIVVGYGSQKKSDLTGGVASISSKEIQKIPAIGLSQRLQGQVPGMVVTNTQAKPGSTDPAILIRGKKTLQGSSSPLIVLDGVIFNGGMSEINANSIDGITILKDASSAAIYGSRAANGVILVTTKKGKIGKPTVSYNALVGFQNAQRLLKMRNGDEYIQFLKDYRKDANDPKWDDPTAYLQTALIDNYNNGTTYDWTKEMFRTAFQTSQQLSVSGATDETNYYLSLNYDDQANIVKDSKGYKKYSLTSNISQNIGQFVKMGVNIQYSERDRAGAHDTTSPEYMQAFTMSPFASLKDEDGKYIRYPMYGETLFYSPYANIDRTYKDKSNAVYLGGFVDVKIPWVKGLDYRFNVGYSNRHRDRGTYYPTTTKTGEPINGEGKIQGDNWRSWLLENIVNYKLEIDKHSFSVTGMYSAEKKEDTAHSMTANDFVSDGNLYHNMALAKGKISITSGKNEIRNVGVMGRLNYGYDSKYLFTFTAREDGTSVYSDGNKWGFFPSVAGAWVATEEKFFKVPVINYLKLRLSYGSNGNVYTNAYNSFTKLDNQDYIFGQELGGGVISPLSRGNGSLEWEKTKTANLGIDFHLLQSRLSGTIDLYDSETTNLLMTKTIPLMNGYSSTPANVGKVGNKGIEITLTSRNIETDKFQWSTSLTLSRNWDKIKDLQRDKNGNKLDNVANKWFIGRSVNVYYDYKVIGIWQEAEREEAAKYKAVPGDAKIWDVNESGTITAADRVVIGSKAPKWVAGLKNEFTYQNFSLSVFLTGSFGAWHENSSIKFERMQFNKNTNYLSDINYWTPENPSNKYTRLNYQNNATSFYKKVNYIRIQDINLSYNFPKILTNKLMIQNLTTFINISNLATISNANKYTTNVESENYTYNQFPVQRAFFFGANITF